MKKIILICALFVLSTAAMSQSKPPASSPETVDHFVSGQELYRDYRDYKKDDVDSFGTALYAGFVVGVVDTANLTMFCLPPSLSQGQIASIVGRYLESNPQRLHFSGARLVIEAMQEHYPCESE